MTMLAQIDWQSFVRPEMLLRFVRVAILLVVGLPLAFAVAGVVGRACRRRLSEQAAMIVRKMLFYTLLALLTLMIVYELGFNLTALLGAAGIAGIAIGFASQTSVSNIISGLFLIGEKPFAVGDVIKVDGTTGTVLSIDLLSLKLRTFDNQFVRIPNETLMKTQLTNITRFPIRRIDTPISVAYKEDLQKVQAVLAEVAQQNPYVLDEPEPLILLTGFGESGIEFLFATWCAKTDFLQVRRTLLAELKQRLDDEGIEIPFPHRTLYTGAVTQPLPIQIVDPSNQNQVATSMSSLGASTDGDNTASHETL